jgi:hypothetical protein
MGLNGRREEDFGGGSRNYQVESGEKQTLKSGGSGMKFLTNLANSRSQMDWFEHDPRQIEAFLERNRLDGIELIFHGSLQVDGMPVNSIKGIHLSYWPMWLDFWRGNKAELLRQFSSWENIQHFYGSLTKEALLSHYQRELERARELAVEYMVFHVSHVQMEHIYSWDFTYSDEEVLEAAAELINGAFGKEDLGIDLLFENLWWPGLNFLRPELTEKFFRRIDYPRKGFMLDIGHLMLTNSLLKDEEEACAYILERIEQLGELKRYIRGIHLNKALAGEYLRQDHSDKRRRLSQMPDFGERYLEARKHILMLDRHLPFDHPCIQKVIQALNP